jgi:hypothetical protein
MGERLLAGLAVVLGLGLSSSAQAEPSAYTGTFQITIEGSSSGWATSTMVFTIDDRNYTAAGSDPRTTNRSGQFISITPMRLWAGMPDGGVGGFGR